MAEIHVVVVEEVCKGVPTPEESSENVVCLLVAESTTSAPAKSVKESRVAIEAATSTSLFEAFFAVLVINLSFLGVRKHRICFTDFLENFTSFFLIVRVFVLEMTRVRSCSAETLHLQENRYLQDAT